MWILGLNNMHDASAALVHDGILVAAAEEERFSRVKHAVGFPVHAIRYCLKEAGIEFDQIDTVAVSWKYWVVRRRLLQVVRSLGSWQAFQAKTERAAGQMSHEWFELLFMRKLLTRHFGPGRYELTYIGHHLAHAASAFLVSPYEQAAILTLDGAGEEMTTAIASGQGTRITLHDAIYLPHSLGQFYSAITAFLGFKTQSDEYKVMGMAAYGESSYAPYFRREILHLLPDGTFRFNYRLVDYHMARKGRFVPALSESLGHPRRPEEPVTQRHLDIAASAQVVLEEAILHLARHLYRRTKMKNLCIAGGVGLNCLANSRLLRETEFEHIYVQPAAGDNGTSLGAAFRSYHRKPGTPRGMVMSHAYWGPQFSTGEIQNALRNAPLVYEELPDDRLYRQVADDLANQKLVFWFQGRMEWGPRALGNRSLLADPRRRDVRELINVRVKQREIFRPFAPSVLEEKSHEYFGNKEPAPFMLATFPVERHKRDIIPAVVHEDGTARVQTVSRRDNPRYWELIHAFERQTGVPVLLNTSFNVNEPIVCTPEEAIRCFLRTDVDRLVLNNVLVKRPECS